jgi:hypothetical protein
MRKRVRKLVVYRYLEFNAATASYRVASRFGTRTAIRHARGLPIEKTASLVREAALDASGFLEESDAGPLPAAPRHVAFIGAVIC